MPCRRAYRCICICELGSSTDITCGDLIGYDLLFSSQIEQAADPLVLALCGIVDGGVCTESTCIDLEDTDLTDERVGDRLEYERSERILE